MPTINPLQFPNFDAALKEAGLIKSNSDDLKTILEKSGLSPIEVLDNVGNMMRNGETSQTRLKAAEIGLKLNGLLKNDEAINAPSVTIIINDSQHTGINPILIPRSQSI